MASASENRTVYLKPGQSFMGGKVVDTREYYRQKRLEEGRELTEKRLASQRGEVTKREIIIDDDTGKQVGLIEERGKREVDITKFRNGQRETQRVIDRTGTEKEEAIKEFKRGVGQERRTTPLAQSQIRTERGMSERDDVFRYGDPLIFVRQETKLPFPPKQKKTEETTTLFIPEAEQTIQPQLSGQSTISKEPELPFWIKERMRVNELIATDEKPSLVQRARQTIKTKAVLGELGEGTQLYVTQPEFKLATNIALSGVGGAALKTAFVGSSVVASQYPKVKAALKIGGAVLTGFYVENVGRKIERTDGTPREIAKAVLPDVAFGLGLTGIKGVVSSARTIGQVKKLKIIRAKIINDKKSKFNNIFQNIPFKSMGKRGTLKNIGKRKITKAQMRKNTFNQAYDPNVFIRQEKGVTELGKRFRTKQLKDIGVLERRTKYKLGETKIEDVGRSPLTGKKETLISVIGKKGDYSYLRDITQTKKYSGFKGSQSLSDIRQGYKNVQKEIASGKSILVVKPDISYKNILPQQRIEIKPKKIKVVKGTDTYQISAFDRSALNRNIILDSKRIPIFEQIQVPKGFRPGTFKKLQARVQTLKNERLSKINEDVFSIELFENKLKTAKIKKINNKNKILDYKKTDTNINTKYNRKLINEVSVKPKMEISSLIFLLLSKQQASSEISIFRDTTKQIGKVNQKQIQYQQQQFRQQQQLQQQQKTQKQSVIKQTTDLTRPKEFIFIGNPIKDVARVTPTKLIQTPKQPSSVFTTSTPFFGLPPLGKPRGESGEGIAFGLREKKEQGYDAYVKRTRLKKGKGNYFDRGFEKVNTTPLTKKAAKGKAMGVADRYTNRTITIKKARGFAVNRPDLENKYERLKRKFTQKNNRWVEKTTYAIDSPKERRGIPYESARLRSLGGGFEMARKKRKKAAKRRTTRKTTKRRKRR